ncbi:hypothetical protein [Bradyrhizobium lablabi]|uniref:hypothetical protein n=1 Tax=Bradyrhizobium lablabi TaxID=722472 RepID=UPI000A85B20D|nr:hypothetical protein [Bradyrhizobium lablabi]
MISRTTCNAALLRSRIDQLALQLNRIRLTTLRLRVARHALEKEGAAVVGDVALVRVTRSVPTIEQRDR